MAVVWTLLAVMGAGIVLAVVIELVLRWITGVR